MLIMLAVNILLIDQLLCSLVWVISLGLNFKRSWHVIMNINIWQPQEKRIKKQWVKLLWLMICGSLWIFAQNMNAGMRFLFKKLQHFPFHSCILEAKFCRTISLVIFNFLSNRHRFGLDQHPTVMRPLRLSSECSSVHMLLPICAHYPLKWPDYPINCFENTSII